MERTTVILLIIILILIIVSVILLVLYLNRENKSVKSSNVPKILGTYSVTPNVDPSSLKFQYSCTSVPDGSIGTSVCSFSGIQDLNTAIGICNKYTNNTNSFANCSGFIYSPSTSVMNIINTQYPITSSPQDSTTNGDVYLKQTNF